MLTQILESANKKQVENNWGNYPYRGLAKAIKRIKVPLLIIYWFRTDKAV